MKADLYVPKGVPVIRGTNISAGHSWKGDWVYIPEDFAAEMPNCIARSGDLVFPHRGSIGEVALIPADGRKYMISTSLMKFRPDPSKALPSYLLYYFRSHMGREEILRFASQVGTPGIGQPLASLRQFKVVLPPIEEQQAIASILTALDDKIDLNRRMNETLEAMARAIFKDWFVDFGPTRAKMEGRPPYLAPDLWALFPERLDDEGKPEGWDIACLGDIAELNPSERLPVGSMAPYLDMAALPTRGFWPDAPFARPASSGARFRNGDTLFARITPCLENGKTAYISRLSEAEIAWGSTEFIVIRPKPPFPSELGYLLARDDRFREHAIQSMTGTSGRQRVQPEALRAFPVVRPPTSLLKHLAGSAGQLFQKMRANELEGETLAAARDLLLPKLISGEIRVREAEQFMAAVA